MQRRTLIATGIAWGALAGAGGASTGKVHFEGFLVFEEKLTLASGAKLSVYVQDLRGIQHGDHILAKETKAISDTNSPWGFSLAAVAIPDGQLFLAANIVSDEHALFEGLVRGTADELSRKRQRIEMHYRPPLESSEP